MPDDAVAMTPMQKAVIALQAQRARIAELQMSEAAKAQLAQAGNQPLGGRMSAIASPGSIATARTVAHGARPWAAMVPCMRGAIIEKPHCTLQSDPLSGLLFFVSGLFVSANEASFANPSWSSEPFAKCISWPLSDETTTPWSPGVAAWTDEETTTDIAIRAAKMPRR